MTTYFSPYDDTTTIFLQFIQSAQKSIYIAIYTFTLEPLVELLIQKKQAGADVRLILDKSQSTDAAEAPVIVKLKAAGIPVVIGTSPEYQIMHNKFTVVDGEWVQSGSWNYTDAASEEANFFDIVQDPTRASNFLAYWQKLWNWILANEPQ